LDRCAIQLSVNGHSVALNTFKVATVMANAELFAPKCDCIDDARGLTRNARANINAVIEGQGILRGSEIDAGN
jgi:hypothetical protein